MIDSWALFTIERKLNPVAPPPYSQLHSVWPQMASPAFTSGMLLASFLLSWRKWRQFSHLYILQWFRHLNYTLGKLLDSFWCFFLPGLHFLILPVLQKLNTEFPFPPSGIQRGLWPTVAAYLESVSKFKITKLHKTIWLFCFEERNEYKWRQAQFI